MQMTREYRVGALRAGAFGAINDLELSEAFGFGSKKRATKHPKTIIACLSPGDVDAALSGGFVAEGLPA